MNFDKEKLKNIGRNILSFLWNFAKKVYEWVYSKLMKISFWQRVLYLTGGFFLLMLLISLLSLIFNGTLGSLVSCISFGALLFIDILIIVLFYYDIRNSKGLEAFINEFDEVTRKFSRLTEKSELSIPWYMVLGEKGSGKTDFLEKSNIHFFRPKKIASSEINTYFNKSALFWKYDIFKTIESQDTEDDNIKREENGNSDFETFLQFLKSRRNILNLNGIVLAVPADELINNNKDFLVKKGKEYSEVINNIQHTLGICLPLYLVITKSDKICGFTEFFKNINPKFYKQVFGWTNKISFIGEKFSADDFIDAMGEVVEKCKEQRSDFLNKFITESSKSEYYDSAAYFAFNENLKLISVNAAVLTESIGLNVYSNSRLHERKFNIVPLFVRGIYFTSVEQNTAYFDKIFFTETKESVELKRNETSVTNNTLFAKELVEGLFYKGSDISMRITSLRSSYKWKRVAGISIILTVFAFLLIFTTVYWFNVFSFISFDKTNLTTKEKQSLRSHLFYPSKDVSIAEARNNYLILMEDMAEINNDVQQTNNSLVSSDAAVLTVPYTELQDTKVNAKFTTEYFSKVTGTWDEISKLADKNVKVVYSDKLKNEYYTAKTNYFAYRDQYFTYWTQILNQLSAPNAAQWNIIKDKHYQYWQIANSFRKTSNVILHAFSVFKEKTVGQLPDGRAAELDNILKSLESTNAQIADTMVQNKAVGMTAYWNKIFNASSPVAARDIIFSSSSNVFNNRVVFQYTQKDQNRNFYQEYWQNLSLAFLKSLGNGVLDDAKAFLAKLNDVNKFPVNINFREGDSLSVEDVKYLQDALNKYWPPEKSYSKETVGHSSMNIDQKFKDAVVKLRPQLERNLMTKVDAMHTLVNNILPVNGHDHTVKVYLLPPGNGLKDNTGADYWTIMKMSQDKSTEKTTEVRTRSEDPEYLGKLTYPSTGKIKFDFYRTLDSTKGFAPGSSLAINDIWGALRLIFNGPDKPQAFKGEYFVTWKGLKQVDDNSWISKISFIKNDGKEDSFYIKLVFSSNVGPITKV